MEHDKTRTLIRKQQSERALEGDGFPVRRPFPTHGLDHVDPFLLLDEAGPIEPKNEANPNMNDHPHRGFETLTYFLSGTAFGHDSSGFEDTFYPGDIEWTTAGAGIIHGAATRGSEPMRGIQLWVNLPKSKKWIPPKSQRIPAASVPTVVREGYQVNVLAGVAEGVEGPAKTTWPILYLHYALQPNGSATLEVPEQYHAMIYVLRGGVTIGNDTIREGELGILSDAGAVAFSNSAEVGTELLLLGAEPIREPVARYGPFVMNTREEVFQAFDDFRAGKFGAVPS
jgi:redox-sensitive bicupin YhaK (pirin superfamily)